MDGQTLIFHIGTNKTGSSALQEFFLQNQEKLCQALGVYYPLPEKPLWNEEYKIGSGNGQWLFNCAEDSLNEKQKKRVADLIELAMNQKYTLVSSEFLWLIKNNKAFWKHFVNKGIQIKVLVYLRRQDEYLESAVNQHIKRNKEKVIKYPECVDELMKAKVPRVRLEYYSRIEEIAGIIGRENIIVRIYDRQRFYGGNIYSDFFHALNMDIVLKDYKIPQNVINPSLTKECVQIKSICNSLPLEEKVIFDCFFDSCLKVSLDETEKGLSSTNLWNNKVKNSIMKYYRKENVKLFITYFHEDTLDNVWKKKETKSLKKDNDRSIFVAIKLFAYILCRQNERIKELEKIILKGDIR